MWLLVAFVLGLIVAVVVLRRVAAWLGRWRGFAGRRAERKARRLLESAGYDILNVHPKTDAVVIVDGRALPADQVFQRLVLVMRQAAAGLADAGDLEREADEIGLKDRFLGNRRDYGGALRADLDETKLGQTEECIAHGLARDAHLGRDLRLGQFGAGGQGQVHDALIEHVINLVGHRTRTKFIQ